MPLPLPSKLMSEVPGQSGRALPFPIWQGRAKAGCEQPQQILEANFLEFCRAGSRIQTCSARSGRSRSRNGGRSSRVAYGGASLRLRSDYHLRARGRWTVDLTTSREHSMNRSTTGVKVRFFSVKITTGHGRIGKSSGNTFSESR
jgi:hypothetical protein